MMAAFIKRYDELFEELREAKRIRCFCMRINRKAIHDWSNKGQHFLDGLP